jgi:hypothetical protein
MTELNKEVTAMVDNMTPALRAEVFTALLAKKAEVEKTGGAKLLTPSMSAAADSRHKVIIRQLSAQCGRYGYRLPDNELVDLAALNKALDESKCPTDTRMAIKSNMAMLSLIR